jgi:hypothetical protein
MAMSQETPAEPPSPLPTLLFIVGQNSRGNWVVQDRKGMCGGVFVDRKTALGFVRAQNRYRPHAVVIVSGNLELNMRDDVRPQSALGTKVTLRRRIA